MDDELDLPDNDDHAGGLIESLFSDQTRVRPRRAESAGRRPTVTFREPPRTPPSIPTVPTPQRPSSADPPPSGLFDNLFSSATSIDSTRPRTAAAATQQSRRSTEAPVVASVPVANTAELEQLRREASTLRFERNELQQTINELHKAQTTQTEAHEKTLRQLRNQHRDELERLKKLHSDELATLRNSIEDDVDVVRNVKRQEDQLITVQSRLENVTYTLNSLRDAVNSMGNYNDSINKIVDLADQQINQGMSTLHTEMGDWERRRQTLLSSLEGELDQLTRKYSEEIVQGRKWVEEERERIRIEQRAFQEEQSTILTQIEIKRAELEQYRTDFITKEHDLLVRVVNERAQLDDQKREFQRQRNADILRMREEAEHLERCLQQVEQSHHALERTRKELEEKHKDLDDLHDQLVQHEATYFRSNQGFQ